MKLIVPPMTVSSVYVRDDYGQNVSVSIDGVTKPFTRIGRDYSKELKIDISGSIGPAGTVIDVTGDTATTSTSITVVKTPALSKISDLVCRNGKAMVYIAGVGLYRIDITSLDGKIVKSIAGMGPDRYTLDVGSLGGRIRSSGGVYLITVRQGNKKTLNRVMLYKFANR